MPNCDMLAKGRASSWKNSALHRLSWCTVGALRVLLIPFPGARSRSLGRGPAVLRQKETSCPKAATRTPRAGTPAASPNLAKASACCGAVLRGKPCLCVADAPAAPVWQRGFSWGGPGACSPLKGAREGGGGGGRGGGGGGFCVWVLLFFCFLLVVFCV